jgi:hypothetical protein
MAGEIELLTERKLTYVVGHDSGSLVGRQPSPKRRLLASSAVAVSHTGDTNETTMATVTLPILGANDRIEVSMHWTVTNNANAKTLRHRLGGVSGTTFFAFNAASMLTLVDRLHYIQNRGATNSQIGAPLAQLTANGNSAASTGAVDTSIAQDFVISAQLGNGTDTATLESYMIELVMP